MQRCSARTFACRVGTHADASLSRLRRFPITGPRTNFQIRTVHFQSNFVEPALGKIIRAVAEQVLMMDLLSQRRYRALQRFLTQKRIFLAARVTREQLARIVDKDALHALEDLDEHRYKIARVVQLVELRGS